MTTLAHIDCLRCLSVHECRYTRIKNETLAFSTLIVENDDISISISQKHDVPLPEVENAAVEGLVLATCDNGCYVRGFSAKQSIPCRFLAKLISDLRVKFPVSAVREGRGSTAPYIIVKCGLEELGAALTMSMTRDEA